MVLTILTAAAVFLNAQDTTVETSAESSPAPLLSEEYSTFRSTEEPESTGSSEEDRSEVRQSANSAEHLKNTGLPGVLPDEEARDEPVSEKEPPLSGVQWGATIDMQVDKEMWDEFSMDTKNRSSQEILTTWYRDLVDDFWMRIALRGSYHAKYLESAFALRFYPYWTMRREGKFESGLDLSKQLEVIEINQAFLKVFKEYATDDNRFTIHFKIGRDGLLTTGSQLFGNYLELPTAGYGVSRKASVVGPFKNRKVFTNQIETGFHFEIGEVISGRTSLMIGGNVNNQKWYTAPSPQILERMDSKFSAGFTRGYQDLYFWKERIHLGGGYRVYTTKGDKHTHIKFVNDSNQVDSFPTKFTEDKRFVNGDWTFDIRILPGLLFYSEFGYQRLGFGVERTILRPFTAGITIPTGGVLDLLAVEVENVSNTFFNDKSYRDPIGNRRGTNSFAWGIVTEKWFFGERAGVAWGVYSASPYGDMKTSLRITSNLK